MVFGRRWAGWTTLAIVAALCMDAVHSRGAELVPVCGTAAADTPEGGCWQPLEGKRACHVWNPNPQPDESAAFEGRSRCRDGKLSGTGTLTWTVREEGVVRSESSTGPYSDGRMNGRFVLANPDGYRGEGEYVDGEAHGHWVSSYPPGTADKWDRAEGSWVGGKRYGDWLFRNAQGSAGEWDRLNVFYVDGMPQGNRVYTNYEEVDGEFRETERAEGPVLPSLERHGDWDIVLRSFTGYSVRWTRLHGPYAEGERHGRWVELSHRAMRDQYDARGVEAAYESEQEEGSYVDGKRHGNWVVVEDRVEDLDEVLADAAAAQRSIRREGAYAEGERHGTWNVTLSNGHRVVRNYAQGRLDGAYEARDSLGSVLVAANLEGGEVTGLRLPKAAMPPNPDSDSARSPVAGGFGIALGPDMEQLGQLACGDVSCKTEAFEQLHGTLEDFGQSRDISGFVDDVPNPITRGRLYDFSVSPWVGVSQVRAWLHFESAEACEGEKVRIDGLLREKYGECRDYRFRADRESGRPIGQCDVNGLPVAVAETRCTTWYGSDDWDAMVLSYGVLVPAVREAVLGAWREKGDVRASEL